jgi:hypothetical protein
MLMLEQSVSDMASVLGPGPTFSASRSVRAKGEATEYQSEMAYETTPCSYMPGV